MQRLRPGKTAWPRRAVGRAICMAGDGPGGEPDFEKLAEDGSRWIDQHPERLTLVCRRLGLSAGSLRRLRVGYSTHHAACPLPMRDGWGNVIGIRLPSASGRKLAVPGGKEGLFVPTDLARGGRLLIAEGPTDCAALLDLGFCAVGRPSCTGGVQHLVALVGRLPPLQVTIVADAGPPGQAGAERLAAYAAAIGAITRPRQTKMLESGNNVGPRRPTCRR